MTSGTHLKIPPPGLAAQSNGKSSVGLHEHSLEANMPRLALTEAVGTLLLVLTIINTAIAATLAKPVAGVPYGSPAVPLAGGLALACLVVALGPMSGAHLNPAMTVGLAANRRFPWKYAPLYVGAQFLDAVVAGLIAWALYGNKARSVAGLGATYPTGGVGGGPVLGAEAIVTFLLVTVVVVVATDKRVPPGVAGLAIGFALAAAILISGPLTGGGVNPARSIGPMIPVGRFTDWWAYVVGPLVGGTVAVALFERLIRPGVAPL